MSRLKIVVDASFGAAVAAALLQVFSIYSSLLHVLLSSLLSAAVYGISSLLWQLANLQISPLQYTIRVHVTI